MSKKMIISEEQKEEIINKFKKIIDQTNEDISHNENMDVFFDSLSGESIDEDKLLITVEMQGGFCQTFDLMEDIKYFCGDDDDPSYIAECFFLKKQLINVISMLDKYINKSMDSIPDDSELLNKIQELISGKISFEEYSKWEKKYYLGEFGD